MFKQFILASIFFGSTSVAFSDIIYTPINPSFGGNPLYSNHLLGLADAQNQFTEDFSNLLDGESSLADQFVDQLSGAVISGAASEITEAIFEDGAPPTGVFTLDDAVISYVLDPVSDTATVTVFDGTDTSVIVIPNPTTN